MENKNPIYVFATWKAKEGHITTVLNLLKTFQKKSVQEEGNLFYKIHQVNSDLNTIVLYEGYTNETALAEHRSSIHFKEMLEAKIVPLLEERAITLTSLID